MVDTDSSTVPSTRQNSFISLPSRTTSFSSFSSKESGPDSSVRENDFQSPSISSTQRVYPRLPYDSPVDEPSVFRDSPSTDGTSKTRTRREAISLSPSPRPSFAPTQYNDEPRTSTRQPPTPPALNSGPSRPTLLVPKISPTITPRGPPQKAASLPTISNNDIRAPVKLLSIPAALGSEEEKRVLNPAFPADLDFLKKMELSDAHHIIAHDKRVQGEMDLRRNSWGVQYEIARGVSKGDFTWSDVTPEKLDLLTGSNAEAAPKVYDVILGRQPSTRVVNKEHWSVTT